MSTIATGRRNFPPEYLTFKTCGVPAEYFAFPGGEHRVNRFAARYRFAKEFQSARFESFGSTTAAGYSALCKLLFTYAAFEALRRALNLGKDLTALDLTPYPLREWDAALRAAPTHDRLFKFLTWRQMLENGNLRAQCRQFLAGKDYNVLLLATAVRNSFAHGHLTPGANKTEAGDTATICGVLVTAFVAVMDAEFSRRVTEPLEELEAAMRQSLEP